ncbi:MAG TPA: hypothetical protein PKY82_33120, partial [Pyrinomonadaceae bacterium]|nr:hypothetical protein [Pyrinomonadaceae bacterium]
MKLLIRQLLLILMLTGNLLSQQVIDFDEPLPKKVVQKKEISKGEDLTSIKEKGNQVDNNPRSEQSNPSSPKKQRQEITFDELMVNSRIEKTSDAWVLDKIEETTFDEDYSLSIDGESVPASKLYSQLMAEREKSDIENSGEEVVGNPNAKQSAQNKNHIIIDNPIN